MLKNYFITSLRNLWKDKLNTVINTIGLSLGIACCILILLFVQNELSYDKFHSKSDRIFRAWVLEKYNNGNEFFNTVTPYPLADALKVEIPEVEEVVQVSVLNWKVVNGAESNNERIHMVSPSFFKVFDFNILKGNSDSPLSNVQNLVITENIAFKYFGNAQAVGKTIRFDLDGETKTFDVTAVVENPPKNSSLQFDFLISDLNKNSIFGTDALENWFNVNAETYVLLRNETQASTIDSKLKAISDKYVGMPKEDGTFTIGLQALTDIHLNPDFPIGIAPVSNPKYSFILGAIALTILVIACINFIILSISRSVGRAKEVGLRKSIGASNIQIIQQFLSEAIIMVFIGLLVGLLLARLFLPTFNMLSNKELEMTFTPYLVAVSIGLIFIIGIVAGSYPAFVVSNFKSATILKGGNAGVNGKGHLRRVLVGIQFALSIGLIACTLIMREQLNYLRNKDLGFDRDQLISIQLQVPESRLTTTIQKGMEIAEIYKSKLAGHPEIVNVSAASHSFSAEGWTKIGYSDTNGKYREFNLNIVSPNYLQTMGMKVIRGRSFQEGNESDKLGALIVNEAFAKEFGINDLNGAIIPDSPFADHEIIGIVKDFNYSSLHGNIEPVVLTLNPSLFFTNGVDLNIYSDPTPKLFVRLGRNGIAAGIQILKKTWNEVAGDQTFNFQFVDDQINAMYKQEQNLGKIVGIAAIITILVGSLGLFALVSLNIKTRMKELSIRKILGATNGMQLFLVSKEYVVLVAIALVASIPITWYIMLKWLSGFSYRIDISPIFFIMAGLVSLAAAILSIGYHSLKAVRTQPIEYLRQE
ncbi:ABC transporter permease [Flavobacteriaceae bacterium F89]|uniref:ABC transporter permease n=1 Tax=Cerina litoralis TaxID=2874477 RepID=A0AAE3ESN6_9FLAO|nr:ABC transporter permease [Cerina litoralis]MCG2459775.1 ABC transporter permease [Cerina litoralis]